jgi:hypothetical protein
MAYPPKGTHNVGRPDPTSPDGWRGYTCAHCGIQISGAVVGTWEQTVWLICTNCGEGSVKTNAGIIYPSVPFGPKVEALPPAVAEAYTESRTCMAGGAYTACELMCRKILMHVAAEKGAKPGLAFAAYLDYLEKAGHITATMKPWVDLIREHGNQSTHELPSPDQARAESTVMFTAELLRLVYEIPALAQKYAPPRPAAP